MAARQLLGAVGLEWLDSLVAGAATSLVLEASRVQAVVGDSLGEAPSLVAKRVKARPEDGVEQPDPCRLAGADGIKRWLHEPRRRWPADTARQ